MGLEVVQEKVRPLYSFLSLSPLSVPFPFYFIPLSPFPLPLLLLTGLRTAAKATIETPIGDILVYSDHFDPYANMEGRLRMMDDMLQDCKQEQESHPSEGILLNIFFFILFTVCIMK
jgi:hypothetical protein